MRAVIDLTNPIFNDEAKAREFLEAERWPHGPVCPHCEAVDAATKLKGKSTRPGVYKCKACEKPYSVTVGTVLERSKIPLHKWMLATFLLSSSKKGMSAHQLHRNLKVTYKTAWFMFHRIREAMRSGGLAPPMGGGGGIVEVDETFIGRKRGVRVGGGGAHKHAVVTLVDRKGEARSFHVENLRTKTIVPIIKKNIERETRIATDEAGHYDVLRFHFRDHAKVTHSRFEWVRGEIHTNTVEGYFSVFKRGMKGIYQHCGEQHLHRYLAEFDFRYSNRSALGIDDAARARKALRGIGGKRLTYGTTRAAGRA